MLKFERGFPGGSLVENLPANAGDAGDVATGSWLWKIPWRKKWQLSPIFFLGNPTDREYLVGYSPWHHKRIRHN